MVWGRKDDFYFFRAFDWSVLPINPLIGLQISSNPKLSVLGSSKVELLYQNMMSYVFKPAMTPDWISKFHGNHQSKNPILKTLESGVFTGSYGYHGIEIIHFLGKS